MRFFALFAALFMMALPVQTHAQDYAVDYAQSTIGFSGVHAGNDFEGVFEEWQASIVFDADNLEGSRLSAGFKPASAKTGNAMYDGTLPQADWFDVQNHQGASFESTSIRANDDGSYRVDGDLTLRGITRQVSFDFTLSDLGTAPVNAVGTLVVDRLAFDIGKKSDPKAEWVSQEIKVSINITANPL